MEQRVEMQLGGRRLVLETGRLAKQANAAVMVRYGDTAVLCTVTASNEPKDLDFSRLRLTMKKDYTQWVKSRADLLNAKADRVRRLFCPAV